MCHTRSEQQFHPEVRLFLVFWLLLVLLVANVPHARENIKIRTPQNKNSLEIRLQAPAPGHNLLDLYCKTPQEQFDPAGLPLWCVLKKRLDSILYLPIHTTVCILFFGGLGANDSNYFFLN